MGKNFLLFWDNSFCLLGDNLFCSLMRQFISSLFGKSFILLGEKSILLWENFTLIRDFFLIKKHFCFLKRELLSDISKLISYQHEIDCETTEHKKLQQIQHWLSLAQLSSACFFYLHPKLGPETLIQSFFFINSMAVSFDLWLLALNCY